MLKGMGISVIMKMTVGLLVASLFISAATIGSLGDAVRQGVSDMGQATDFTTEVDSRHTLSDLAMFVEHRAINEGCELVDEINSGEVEGSDIDHHPSSGELNGYLELEGTRLTQNPQCFGGEAGFIRDQLNWMPMRDTFGGAPDENYMPGIYSREQFEITSDITLDTSNSDTWLEGRLGSATDKTLNELGEKQRDSDSSLGAGMIIMAPAALTTITLYQAWKDETNVRPVSVVFETQGFDAESRMVEEGDGDDKVIKVQFCPGDKGYIQGNRKYIDNEKFSEEDPLYPVIVIQELGTDCGEVGLDRVDKIPEEASTRGRMLHIAGRTDESHPYVRCLGSRCRLGDYSFDLIEFNEEESQIDRTLMGSNIRYTHNSNKANKCVMGLYDQRSTGVDATGWITFHQGTHIPYDGEFPSRYSSDVDAESLEDRTDRSVPPYPSAVNLYDQYATEGFNDDEDRQPWGQSSVEDKILYDFGNRDFQLYGDLLCGPDYVHSGHATWYLCDGSTSSRYIDGEQWTCDEDGRWSK